MGNNIVMGARFKPYSYQELVEPLRHAETQHQEVENAYGELSSKAAIWENLANSERDTKAYQMYKNYSEQLKGAADTLNKQGLNASSRPGLIGMKTQYNQNIIPIEMAFTNKQKEVAAEKDLAVKDPSRVYKGPRASETSLDKFVENPNLTFNSLSGDLLTKEVGTLVSPLAKEGRGGVKVGNRLLGFNYGTTSQTGYTNDEIELQKSLYISGPEGRAKMDPILRDTLDNILTKYGVSEEEFGEAGNNKLITSALNGLNFAIGSTANGTLKDDRAELNYKAFLDKKASESKPEKLGQPQMFSPNQSIRNKFGATRQKELDSDKAFLEYLILNPNALDPKATGDKRLFLHIPNAEEMAKNLAERTGMSLENAKKSIYQGGSTGTRNFENASKAITLSNIMNGARGEKESEFSKQELERLRRTYGGEDFSSILQNINQKAKTNMELVADYTAILEDQSLALDIIFNKANTRNTDTGIRVVSEDGIEGEGISKKELASLFSDKSRKAMSIGFSTSNMYPTIHVGEDSYIVDYDILGISKETKDMAQSLRQLSKESESRTLTNDEISWFTTNYNNLRSEVEAKLNFATKKNQ